MERTRETAAATGNVGAREAMRGVDLPLENRPGVPMRADPHLLPHVQPGEPPRQPPDETHFRRKGLDRLTPVYGTAQPPRGVSGTIRRMAYGIPEHSAIHWGMLLAADRVDILEDRLTHGLGPGTLDAMARRIRTNPLRALVLVAVAGVVLRKTLRP
jgi:hypothetical protein